MAVTIHPFAHALVGYFVFVVYRKYITRPGKRKILLTVRIDVVVLLYILNSMQAPHSFSSFSSDCTANRNSEITL